MKKQIEALNQIINEQEDGKIGVLVPLWKREGTAEAMMRHTVQMFKKIGVKGEFVAVGSEASSEKLATSCGFKYVQSPNKPLSQKFQKGLDGMSRDVDGFILLGSDDFINETFLKNVIGNRQEISGPNGYFWININKLDSKDHNGVTLSYNGAYRPNDLVDAGVFFPKAFLERNKWNLWGKTMKNKRVNDHWYIHLFKKQNVKPRIIDLNKGNIMVDVKSSMNITTSKHDKSSRYYDSFKVLKSMVSPQLIKLIMKDRD